MHFGYNDQPSNDQPFITVIYFFSSFFMKYVLCFSGFKESVANYKDSGLKNYLLFLAVLLATT